MSHFTNLLVVSVHGIQQPNYITDGTKVENLFMLGLPTLCPSEVCDWFNDQVITINEILEADKDDDTAANKVYDFACFC